MAVKAVVSDLVNEHGVRTVDWGSIPSGDTGQVVYVGAWEIVGLQRYAGTGTVTFVGSMDNVTFGSLHYPAGTDISIADGEIVSPVESPTYIRPSVATNAASVAMTMQKRS